MYRWNIIFAIGNGLLNNESFTAIKSKHTTICQELLDEIITMLDRTTDHATYRLLEIVFVG